jgi:hypothetical protein
MFRLTTPAWRLCAALAFSLTLGVAAAHAYAPPPPADEEWAFDVFAQGFPGNFNDGGLIQGGFSADATTGAVTGWNITTTTTSGFTGYNYTPSDSKLAEDFVDTDGSVVIQFQQDTGPFGHVLSDDAHVLTVVFGEALPLAYPQGEDFMDAFTAPYECIGEGCTTGAQGPGPFREQCDQCNQIGEVIAAPGDRFGGGPPPPTAAVPEPAAWALMILGFGGIGAALRRRRETIPLTS